MLASYFRGTKYLVQTFVSTSVVGTPTALGIPWLAVQVIVTWLPLLSFVILSVSAFIKWWNDRRTRSTDRGGVISFLIGSRRSPEGRAEFLEGFRDYTFSHTTFRKHS